MKKHLHFNIPFIVRHSYFILLLSAGAISAEPKLPPLALPFQGGESFAPPAKPGDFCQPVESVIFHESFETVASTTQGVVGNGWYGKPGDKLPIVYALPSKLKTPPTALSIEWWMRLDPGNKPPSGTLIHGPGWKVSFAWNETQFGTLHVRFQQAKQGAWIGQVGSDLPLERADGQWHSFVATFDLHTTALYVDGEVVRRNWEGNNADQIGPMADGSNQPERTEIEIGGNRAGPHADFSFHSVAIDELRVSTVALSAWQVRRNFENCRSEKTIFAAPNGSDDAGGEQDKPLSLKAALSRAGPGVRIVLLAGKYNGADFEIAHGGASPLLEACICGLPGDAVALIESENEPGARITGGEFVTLRNLVFVGNEKAALSVDGAAHVTIDACRFAGKGDGIVARNARRFKIQNSIVHVSGTALALDAAECAVKNNTLVGGATGVALSGGSTAPTLLNNIFSGQSKTCLAMQIEHAKGFAGDGNIYDPGADGWAATIGEMNFARENFDGFKKNLYESDPILKKNDKLHAYAPERHSYALHVVFAAPADGDFRLANAAGNPIDAGAEATAQRPVDPPLYDAAGIRRPQGNGVDAGAFESAPPLAFSFKLEWPARTSAAVYSSDGTLVKTLWSARDLPAGANMAFWNGLDDDQKRAPDGNYTFKIAAHHLQYVWEGVIGNTSAALNGPSVHSAFLPIQSMAFTATSGFYVAGYNELGLTQFRFDIKNPQALTAKLGASDYKRAFNLAATDGARVYFVDTNAPGLLVAVDAASGQPTRLSSGKQFGFWNGIEIGGRAGISGLAVQKDGELLFIAHGGEDKIFIYDKRSGAAKGALAVVSPGRIATAANGDLWVCCRIDDKPAVARFNSFDAGSKPGTVINGLEAPAAVGVSPIDDSVLVADGGASQQLKAFDASGKPLWVFGQAGGYDNGPAVTTDKFYFRMTLIAFQPDGSFWVKDEATHRVLHFAPDRKYIDAIMYQPHPFTQTVDPGDPTRAFINWLEFKIDYRLPLTQAGAWKLVNYWGHKLPASAHNNFDDGLYRVVTLDTGTVRRTYGLILGGQYGAKKVVELLPTGLRLTEIPVLEGKIRFEDDGSLNWVERREGVASFMRRDLAPFIPSSNDPRWEAQRVVAQAPAHWSRKESGERWDGGDPVPDDMYFAQWRRLSSPNGPAEDAGNTKNNLIISYNCDRVSAGWHLGGVRERDSQWLWKAAPSGPMDGHGTFDTNVEYAGRSLVVSGREIFFNLHGEFWHNGQANQFFHYLDNGLFIGQFGQPNVGIGSDAQQSRVPGAAGNSFCISVVRVGERLYFYHNDENGHGGSQRWRVDGWNDIQEFNGEVKLSSER